MPKSFDQSKLGFSAGARTSTDSRNISYTVSGNTITGRYDGTLNPNEFLTVRLELPDGYFVNTENNIDLLALLALILPAVFVLFYFFVWVKYGKDENPVETVEFYPPEGFNSAEIGFLYKGKAKSEDIVSLLIYLANKGYIAIAESGKKALFALREGFKITKVRDYDGDNVNEETFLKGLFRGKSTISFAQMRELGKKRASQETIEDAMYSGNPLDEVTNIDLQDKFYTTIERIKRNLKQKENRLKIFEKSSLDKGIWGIVMAVIIYLLVTVRPVLEIHESWLLIFAVVFPVVGFGIFLGILTGLIPVAGKKISGLLFGLVFGVFFGGMPWAFMVLPALLIDPLFMLAHFVGLACISLLFVLVKHMPKRTPYGNELLGRILGFKNFLEIAEKAKLEELVSGEPEYYYNILPYTYVLGVSDKWIKKFETITMQPPGWYHVTHTFNSTSFSAFMNSTMKSATSSMTSNPSSHSGGGSSGGGSGGGRGGSW
jgi:uncharacterized membrane protein